ncbi:apolipoprotein A-IV-like [Eleutherodactylus coqui]|uniref:apolipoprotein A-IV-like n=1 Tax=Eleutherodactylus coqui TaxID=57060 RepID=UPI003461A2C7
MEDRQDKALASTYQWTEGNKQKEAQASAHQQTGALANVDSKILSDASSYFFEQPKSSTKDSSSSLIQLPDTSSLLNSDLQLEDGKSVTAELLNKISFFTKNIYALAASNPEKLRYDLEQLQVQLSPYSEEVTKLLSKTTEDLALTLNPYTEQLQGQLEKITLAFIKELESINLGLDGDMRVNAGIMKLPLTLYSQKLEAKVSECLNALRNAVTTCTSKVKETIDLQVLALYQSLSPFSDNLQGTLRKHMENLNFMMKKSVTVIESKIVETTATLEKQLTLCTTLLKEKNSLFFSNVRKALTLCLYDMSQKIKVYKDVVTPYKDALAKSVVLRVESIRNMLDGSAAISLQDQKDFLEKKIFDKISDLLNGSFLTGTVTE